MRFFIWFCNCRGKIAHNHRARSRKMGSAQIGCDNSGQSSSESCFGLFATLVNRTEWLPPGCPDLEISIFLFLKETILLIILITLDYHYQLKFCL